MISFAKKDLIDKFENFHLSGSLVNPLRLAPGDLGSLVIMSLCPLCPLWP